MKISPHPTVKFLSHIEKILQSNRALLSYVWASTSTFRFVHVLSWQREKVKVYIYIYIYIYTVTWVGVCG
jgi:hypothetical protein